MILEINIFNKPLYVELQEDEIVLITLEDGTNAAPILDRMNRLFKDDYYEYLNDAIVTKQKNYMEFVEEQKGLI